MAQNWVLWYNTCVEVLPSALVHGVNEEQIRHAVSNAIAARDIEDGLLFIGPAGPSATRLLEVIVRRTLRGLVVFHAMELRPQFEKRYLHAKKRDSR